MRLHNCRTLTRLLGGLQVKLPRHLGGFFRNDADHRDFAAIGTAAGAARLSATCPPSTPLTNLKCSCAPTMSLYHCGDCLTVWTVLKPGDDCSLVLRWVYDRHTFITHTRIP